MGANGIVALLPGPERELKGGQANAILRIACAVHPYP